MPTNGAGQGLLAEDWDVTPGAPPRPAADPAASEPLPAPPDASDLPARTGHGLVLTDSVALMLGHGAPRRPRVQRDAWTGWAVSQ